MIEASHIQEAAELRSVLGAPAAPEISIVERPRVRQRRVPWSALLTSVVLIGTAVIVAPRLYPVETDGTGAFASRLIQRTERWLRAEPSAPPPLRATAPTVAPRPIEAAPRPVSPATPVERALLAEPATTVEPAKSLAETSSPEPAPDPFKAASEPAASAPEPVQAARETSHGEPVPGIKQPATMPPLAMIPAPATPPAATRSPTLPIETIALLLRRGREMLALDDLSAARLLFGRAAEGGSPQAMFELGQTYDPAFLASFGAVRLSDRAEAFRWYRRAAAMGNRTAERMLPSQ